MAGTITIAGSAGGLATGSKVIGPLTITGSAVIGEILDVVLASGDNTIAVPTGATAVLIEPVAANAVALKLRTNSNSGDAGLPISPAQPTVYPIPPGVTSLIINAASLTSGATELTFI